MRAKFEQDIRDFVFANLPVPHSERIVLEAKSAGDLLIIYLNWLERLVDDVPRTLSESKVILANPLAIDPAYKSALDHIRDLVRRGGNLTPHLSRGIRVPYQTPSSPNQSFSKRADLDLMLSDWGVHHLHLSTEMECDNFVKRTGPLLFAVFKPGKAFFVDVVDHGGWTKAHIVETIIKEWPDEGIIHEIKGTSGLAHSIGESDRGKLRSAGVNSAVELGGKVYMTVGGMTTAGTSLTATLKAQSLIRSVEAFERHIRDHPTWLSEQIASAGGNVSEHAELAVRFFKYGFGIVDNKSGTLFRLG